MYSQSAQSSKYTELQVNLAYGWFCKLGIEGRISDHWCSAERGTSVSVKAMPCAWCLRGVVAMCIAAGLEGRGASMTKTHDQT